jgi:hypothetical protein
MRQRLLFSFLLFVLALTTQAQTRYLIRGRVTDGVTNKPLPNVSVFDKKQGAGTRTDSTGAYRLPVLPGLYNLTFSAVGYYTRTRYADLSRADEVLDIALNPDIRQLDEVSVKGRAPDANVSAAQMSVIKLDMKNLRNIPVVFGDSQSPYVAARCQHGRRRRGRLQRARGPHRPKPRFARRRTTLQHQPLARLAQ